MSASVRAVVLALSLAPVCFAEDKPTKFTRVDQLWSGDAEVGQYGPIVRDYRFAGGDGFREYTIVEITSATQMVIREEVGIGEARRKIRFVIEGMDTAKLATDRAIDLNGFFKVVRMGKRGGSSLPVFAPVTEQEKEQWEAGREAAKAEQNRKLADKARAEMEEDRQKREKKAEAQRKAEAERKANEEADRPVRMERDAQTLLGLAKKQADAEQRTKALQSIIKQYPKTKAADEARKLLK